MAACDATRNTIHQGISRLRRDGFCIDTIPPPSGPLPSNYYRLIPDQKAKAELYLISTYVPGDHHDNR